MNKDTKIYIKNITKNDFFFIDLVNLMLGLFIIFLFIMAMITGGDKMFFAAEFLVGAILAVVNLVKSILKKSNSSSFLFVSMFFAMAIMIAVVI